MWLGENKEGIMLKLEALSDDSPIPTQCNDDSGSSSMDVDDKQHHEQDVSESYEQHHEHNEQDVNQHFSDLHVSSPRLADHEVEVASVLPDDVEIEHLMRDMPRTEFIYMETAARQINNQKLNALNTRIVSFKSTQGTRIKDKLFPHYDRMDYKSLRKQEQMLNHDQNLLFINEKLFNAFHLLKHHAPVEPELHLAAGAFVVLTATLCSKLPRGSQGIVLEVSPRTNMYPLVHFRNGLTVYVRPYMFETPITKNSYAWYAQIPLRLCWCYLIQDVTSNYAWEHIKIDMSLLKKPNLFYRICSQVQTRKGIKFSKINHIFFNMDSRCTTYNKSLITST